MSNGADEGKVFSIKLYSVSYDGFLKCENDDGKFLYTVSCNPKALTYITPFGIGETHYVLGE